MGNSALLSIEDARPQQLDGVSGQQTVLARLRALFDAYRGARVVPPSLILWGPAGVGKTTVARAFGREMLQEHWENSFNELGASDDRSLRFVKERVASVAGLPPTRGAPFRMIFFDEADQLARDAQAALRPLMESAAGTCVFILACNDLTKIASPLQSRCVVLEFDLLSQEELELVVDRAASALHLAVDSTVRATIVRDANGIPREAVKLLIERAAMTGGSAEASLR